MVTEADIRRALERSPRPRADAVIRFGWLVVGTLVAAAALYSTFVLGGQNATQLALIRELRSDVVSLRSQVDALEAQIVEMGGRPVTQSSFVPDEPAGRQSERPVQTSGSPSGDADEEPSPPAPSRSPSPDPEPSSDPEPDPEPEPPVRVCVGTVCVAPPELPTLGTP